MTPCGRGRGKPEALPKVFLKNKRIAGYTARITLVAFGLRYLKGCKMKKAAFKLPQGLPQRKRLDDNALAGFRRNPKPLCRSLTANASNSPKVREAGANSAGTRFFDPQKVAKATFF